MRPASVDVGSNTVRLMVAEKGDGRSFQIVDRSQRITRLGEGMGSRRRLKSAAIARTLDALVEFRRRWEGLGVTKYRAVATSAVREAENADDFVREARTAGVDIEVISGIQEARLVMDGMEPALRGGRGDLIVIDIGGGSTEFIHSADGAVRDIVSTELGVVRLTERLLVGDPPRQQEIGRLVNFVEKAIDPLYNRFKISGAGRLAGTAGTVTTLAAVSLGLDVYDSDTVEGHILSIDRIDHILREFLTMTGRQRLARYPVMTHGREDVIVAGTIIIKVVMERFGITELTVSDRGILEGIIEGLLEPYASQTPGGVLS
jgi:exopolyphosphatase/guanosine-5'-triphosphate,3'-diphosphate pyrophosphatase